MIIESQSYQNESYSGCDIVATIMMPNLTTGLKEPFILGEISTISYSIHMDKYPVRAISSVNAKDYVLGPRTVAGSLVFTVFNKHVFLKIMDKINSEYQNGYRFLTDELPPFDIIMSYANEYGFRSKQTIYGVRIVNEGNVVSVNDVYTENTYQFVAMDVQYLQNENTITSSEGETLLPGFEAIDVHHDNYVQPIYQITPEHNEQFELQCRVIKLATDSEPGEVYFKLIPRSEDGYIYVTASTGNKMTIQLKNNVKTGSRIYANLFADSYKAYWSNGEYSTSVISFTVSKIPAVKKTELVAPIIEKVENNRICVYSNNKYHTHIIYENPNGLFNMLKMSGKRAELKYLLPESEYKIATCRLDSDEENIIEQSPFVTVTTKKIGVSDFSELVDFIYMNIDLDESNYYNEVINLSKKYVVDNSYLSIVDSIIDANKEYQEDLDNIDSRDYSNLIEYQQRYDYLYELLRVSNNFIIMATKFINDKLYGYNYKNDVIKAPEVIDDINNVLKLDAKTENLLMYMQYKSGYKPCKTVEKKDFVLKYDSSTNEPYYTLQYQGKEGYHYFTYAVNSSGIKSARCDFYVLTEDEKEKLLEERTLEQGILDDQLISTYNNIDADKCESTNTTLTDVALEKSKDIDKPLILAPEIVYISWCQISVSTNEQDDNLYAVISIPEEACAKKFKYKEKFDNGIATFTTERDGIKANKKYSIWIEKDNEQISDSIIIKVPEIEITDEDITNVIVSKEYFISELIEILKNIFEQNNVDDALSKSICEMLESDSSITKSNFCYKAIELINASIPYNDNMEDIYYSLMQLQTNILFKVDNINYDNKIITIFQDSKTILINQPCTVYITYISNKKSIVKISSDLKEQETINNNIDYDFQIAYFKAENSMMGFVIINNISKTFRYYKIGAEVK